MNARNGTAQEHRILDERLGAFKEGVSKLVDRLTGKPDERSRLDAFTGKTTELLGKTTELIKAHPIAAVALGFGLGYLVVRIVRR